MRAITCRRYGSPDVLRGEDVEKPAPRQNEVLIRIRAASVNPLDWHWMRGSPYILRILGGLTKPKDTRLGVDLAGQVEAVGRNVRQFRPGDEVFGASRGAFAEYVCAPEKALAPKPANLTFEQAAAVPVAGAFTALQGLRDKGRLQPGQHVLINGAAGGVGTFAIQIAKALGATVTAVCSTKNVVMAGTIGADHVVDYSREDFTQTNRRYHLIFDCVGNRPLSACRRILHPDGSYVIVGAPDRGPWLGPLIPLFKVALMSRLGRRKLLLLLASPKPGDLLFLKDLLEARKVTPVIDRCYPLAHVPAAIRYFEQRHARGKVVITLP